MRRQVKWPQKQNERLLVLPDIYFVKAYMNQVHIENCSFSPHPQPLALWERGAGKAFKVPLLGATVYTQVF